MIYQSRLCHKFIFIWFLLLSWFASAQAQSEKVTLILQSGEEVPCQLKRIASGYVYFQAASTRLAFKYGDFIEIEKIAQVRLGDGRTLSMNEFLAQRQDGAPTSQETGETPPPQPRARPRPPEPAPRQNPPPSGPGMRLPSRPMASPQTTSGVGLRLPDMPPAPSTDIDYSELANLLAETGLAGALLDEINHGVLRGRILTKSQKALVDAIAQSPAWSARKRDLREAMRVAEGEFNMLTRNQTNLLAEVFNFRYTSNASAFTEFVQFLHVENVLHFQHKWEKLENVFGAEAASALRDILNNYADWHYLFGQDLEKR